MQYGDALRQLREDFVAGREVHRLRRANLGPVQNQRWAHGETNSKSTQMHVRASALPKNAPLIKQFDRYAQKSAERGNTVHLSSQFSSIKSGIGSFLDMQHDWVDERTQVINSAQKRKTIAHDKQTVLGRFMIESLVSHGNHSASIKSAPYNFPNAALRSVKVQIPLKSIIRNEENTPIRIKEFRNCYVQTLSNVGIRIVPIKNSHNNSD